MDDKINSRICKFITKSEYKCSPFTHEAIIEKQRKYLRNEQFNLKRFSNLNKENIHFQNQNPPLSVSETPCKSSEIIEEKIIQIKKNLSLFIRPEGRNTYININNDFRYIINYCKKENTKFHIIILNDSLPLFVQILNINDPHIIEEVLLIREI